VSALDTLAELLDRGEAPAGGGAYLGEVLAAGRGRLQVSCAGGVLEPDDLWLAPGLDYRWEEDTGSDSLLRAGDRVVLLAVEEMQSFCLLSKVVRA